MNNFKGGANASECGRGFTDTLREQGGEEDAAKDGLQMARVHTYGHQAITTRREAGESSMLT